MIILPAEIGCEVGLNEGKNGVTHLVSKHPGPDSWMWGAREWIVDDGGGGEERKSVTVKLSLSSHAVQCVASGVSS